MRGIDGIAALWLGICVFAILGIANTGRAAETAGSSIIVGFTADATTEEIASLEKQHQLELIREFTSIRARNYRLPVGVDVAEILKILAATRGVEYAELDQPVRALPAPAEGLQ